MLWLFGGEFSSPKQNTFYHYNDFWSFDCKSREWLRVETKGKGKGKTPPARSGHRMVGWKNLIVLWGGFQDTSASTKYLNDLWVFDVVSYTWTLITLPAHGQRPDARSSFSLLPHEHGAVLFGGYSKTKVTSAQKKGGKLQTTEMGNVHEDSWLLRLEVEDFGKIRWERRKKPGNAPNPKRVGVTMAPHRGRGIMFGGVYDKTETDEGLESVFFNELFAWGVERNRFFPLVLRKPKQQKRTVEPRGGGGRRDRAKDDEEELLRNLARLEAEKAGKSAEEVQEDEDRKIAEEEKERLALLQQQELSVQLPSSRFHCALAVQDDVLYIYGGTFEKEDREIAFDEMFAIDLGKLDGVRTIFSRETESEWIESDSEDGDEDGEDEESEEEEEEGEEEVAQQKKPKISEEELEARRAEKAKVGKTLHIIVRHTVLTYLAEESCQSSSARAHPYGTSRRARGTRATCCGRPQSLSTSIRVPPGILRPDFSRLAAATHRSANTKRRATEGGYDHQGATKECVRSCRVQMVGLQGGNPRARRRAGRSRYR
jgi:hypothetical protein